MKLPGLVMLLSTLALAGTTRGIERAADTTLSARLPLPGAAHPPPVRPLPFFYDLYTFRGDERTTTVVASFAVPAGRLEREHHQGQVRYRFDVTLVLSDTLRRSVTRTDDSVYVGLPGALSGDHLLFTHIEVSAPPSTSTLQRVIMTDASTPGIGQLYGSSFPIPDYRGDRLMLSDIALAQPGAREGWRRGENTLALLPTSQFPGSSFDVYYEVYNLPTPHRYATEITIESVDADGNRIDDGTNPVRTRFDGESTAGRDHTVYELRRVQASLERGRYRLTVTVTDQESGASARRTRYFQVRRSGPGATLVHALPWKPDIAAREP